MILTDEDIEYIKFAKSVLNKAHYPSSEKVTEVYNRVYSDSKTFKLLSNTSCGSCIRQRVMKMYNDMENVLRKMEKDDAKKNETNNSEQIKTNECKQNDAK